MTSLSRATNGDWFARKGIPKDVRAAYKAAFGVAQEERFRRPGSLSTGAAKAELRDWDATVTGRIEALRAAARGEGQGLTPREAYWLAGQWYTWFLARHKDKPGQPEEWEHRHEQLEEAQQRPAGRAIGAPDEDDEVEASPAARRHVRATVTELGQVASFLGEQGIRLTEAASDTFLDLLTDELDAAFATLRRRADGDFSPDQRPEPVRWSLGAHGRLPRRAQRRGSVFFWPTRASSCHHSSMAVPGGKPARIALTAQGRFF